MELYQEELFNSIKIYQNDFDNMINSFFKDKENFNNLIKKYSCDSEDNVDKNYLLRARLSFSILYYKNLKALNKESVKNIIIYLFNEEIKDRRTSKYKGIGIALEVLTFLLNMYNKDNKELFEMAKKSNNDCAIGYDTNVRFEIDIEKLSIDYCIYYALELGFKDLYYKLIDIWKNSVTKWDRFSLEKLRDFEIKVENKNGELEANKQLYELSKNDYTKNKKNEIMSKRFLFYLASYLSNYLDSLIRFSNYNEAYDIIIDNIYDIKLMNNFYTTNVGIFILNSALNIIINIDDDDKKSKLWSLIREAFLNECNRYSKNIYENSIKCAEYMKDNYIKEKIIKNIHTSN